MPKRISGMLLAAGPVGMLVIWLVTTYVFLSTGRTFLATVSTLNS